MNPLFLTARGEALRYYTSPDNEEPRRFRSGFRKGWLVNDHRHAEVCVERRVVGSIIEKGARRVPSFVFGFYADDPIQWIIPRTVRNARAEIVRMQEPMGTPEEALAQCIAAHEGRWDEVATRSDFWDRDEVLPEAMRGLGEFGSREGDENPHLPIQIFDYFETQVDPADLIIQKMRAWFCTARGEALLGHVDKKTGECAGVFGDQSREGGPGRLVPFMVGPGEDFATIGDLLRSWTGARGEWRTRAEGGAA